MDENNLFGKIASIAIGKHRTIYLIMMIIVFLGISSYFTMPKEVMPKVNLPYAVVMTVYPGATPEAVEREITNLIEKVISNMSDIKKVTSKSTYGMSEIIIEFNSKVDMKDKLQKIDREISSIKHKLPEKSEDSIIAEYDVNNQPILVINLSGAYALETLTSYAEAIKGEIERVDGLKEVKILGGIEKEIQVTTEREHLEFYDINLKDLKDSMLSSNVSMPLGEKELNDAEYILRTDNLYKNIVDIEKTLVTVKNNVPVFLSDVAEVNMGSKDIEMIVVKPKDLIGSESQMEKVINLVIYKQDAADVLEINNTIKKRIVDAKGMIYPESIKITYTSDASKYINKNLNDVLGNAFTGLLSVIVVLFIFINFKDALIIGMVMPLSLLIGLVVLNLVGISYNILSAMGLIMALGMLVDNAIVVIESIHVNMKKVHSIKKATLMSINEVGAAITSSTLTTVGAFLPLAIVSGSDGELVRGIPIAIISVILASLILSITVTPTLATQFLDEVYRQPGKGKKILMVFLISILSLFAFSNNGQLTSVSFISMGLFSTAAYVKLFKGSQSSRRVIDKYERLLKSLLEEKKKRLLLFVATLAMFLVSLIPLATDLLPKESMPVTDSTTISIHLDLPKGSSMEEGKALMKDVNHILTSHKEVESYIAEISKDKVLVTAELLPKDERNKHSKFIISDLLESFRMVPGVKVDIKTFDISGEGPAIVIELRGHDLDLLESYAKSYKEVLSGIDGVVNPVLSAEKGSYQYVIGYNKNMAGLMGLSASYMDYELWQALSDEKLTTMVIDNKEVDIVLKNTDTSFAKKDDLNKLLFTGPIGNKVSLETVAKIEERQDMDRIEHVDKERTIKIIAKNHPSVSVATIINTFKEKIVGTENDQIEVLYTGYAESLKKMYIDFAIKMVVAMLVVYAILVTQFNSFTQPFIIMASVPVAIIGVVWGHMLVGINFSGLSFMGLISLVGIVVNNAIVLMDTINQGMIKEKLSIDQAIINAGKLRFVPVVATTITTIAGVLPLALYNEDYSQMAYTLIFGLMVSTILTLVIVPVIYFVTQQKKKNRLETLDEL